MLAQLNLEPTRAQLRQFGFVAVAAFAVLGGVTIWRGGLLGFDFGDATRTVAYALWGLGLVSGLFAIVYPKANLPLFLTLSVIAFPIGWVISNVVLFVLFFVVLTPLALFFRVIGRDALERKFEPERSSYWIDMPAPRATKDYFRQF